MSRFGATTIRDALAHYPKRYLDMSNICTIGQARIGRSTATIVATVHEAVLKRPKPKFDLVEVTLVDGTGTLIVTFLQAALACENAYPRHACKRCGQS